MSDHLLLAQWLLHAPTAYRYGRGRKSHCTALHDTFSGKDGQGFRARMGGDSHRNLMLMMLKCRRGPRWNSWDIGENEKQAPGHCNWPGEGQILVP